LLHLIVNVDVGNMTFGTPETLLACALLVIAPALIILPVADRLAAPFFDAEAILGWSTLGFIIVFFRPAEDVSYVQFLAFLLPLIAATASIMTLVAYAFVRRIRTRSPRALNVMQARRIGYLAALTLVALALLNALALLTPFNGTLVVAVAVLAELFVVASRQPPLSAA